MDDSAPGYRAFISYTAADRAVGGRFQRAIENYRIPSPFRGLDRGRGPIPKRLTPVFRDRLDADVGGDLTRTIVRALERSDALIVMCSPRSARAPWVNKEIDRYIALGRSERIVAVLIDGQSYAHDPVTRPDGALPAALFRRCDATGKLLSAEGDAPLAADLREDRDGFEYAKLKVVAFLTGIPVTELTQRHLEAERREKRIFRLVASAITGLLLAVLTAVGFAYWAERTARERALKAIDIASGQIDRARAFVDEFGVSTSVLKQLLDGSEADFTALGGGDWGLVPALNVERGRLFAAFAEIYGRVGDRNKQLERSKLALETLGSTPLGRTLKPSTWLAVLPERSDWVSARLDALAARVTALDQGQRGRPSDPEIVKLLEEARELASRERQDPARFWFLSAEFHYRRTRLGPAIEDQSRAIALLREVGAPGDPAAQSELATALSRRAEFLLESEKPGDALADHRQALGILEPLAARHPRDMKIAGDLAAALTQYADAIYAACGSAAAQTSSIPIHNRAVELLQRRHESDRTRVDYASELAVALEHLGDIRLIAGDVASATRAFADMLALRREIALIDPDGVETNRDLALAYERQGDLAMEMGNRMSIQSFEKALTLLTEGPQPTGEDADDRVRDVALALENLAGARARYDAARPWEEDYRRSIAMLEQLVARKDRPLGWLRDLAGVHASYAESLRRRGRLEAARKQLSTVLELLQEQLRENPGDPRLPDDIAEVQGLLGMPQGHSSPERAIPPVCRGL